MPSVSGRLVVLLGGWALLAAAPIRAQEATGGVTGLVTDQVTGQALVGATVELEPLNRSATTGSDGRYRIAAVASGTYTLRVRYVGYRPGTAQVEVGEHGEATANFALGRSAQILSEIVTTGTLLPTEVKAVPNPVSVLTSEEIETRHITRADQLLRQAVPSAVAWDLASNPSGTLASVRGAASITPDAGVMKIYIDGIEISSRSFGGVDPNSIDRIEVIRGPQAATIYGSEATNGVMQIFTKRGNAELGRPEVNAKAAVGVAQSVYDEFGGGEALRQEYAASVQGGNPAMSYSFGGSYTRLGNWLPQQRGIRRINTRQSVPSAYGGVHIEQGPVTLDFSGRYFVSYTASEFDPAILETGFAPFVVPRYVNPEIQTQTYGLRAGFQPTSWWRHSITLGWDRLLDDEPKTQPGLTSPADTLLNVFTWHQNKASLAYHTAFSGPLNDQVSASLTAGFDHYVLRSEQYFESGLPRTDGGLAPAPGSFRFLTRGTTHNTGVFAQAQVAIRDQLFLTGGLRAEDNSNFGEELGTPISPRAGVAYARDVGNTTVKVRASYGDAIRPPTLGQRQAQATATQITLANPNLAPERQRGWDAGFDLVFSRGSLSATYYNQTLRDGIQFAILTAGLPQTAQWLNVAQVKNTGFEFEGSLTLGPAVLRAQYAIARSRARALGPNYRGDLRVGEQLPYYPEHTGGASLTFSPFGGTTLSAGFAYVGEFTSYDYEAQYGCIGGTRPCPESFTQSGSTRDFLVPYPSFVKANLSVNQVLHRHLTGFLAVNNLTNSDAHELDNRSAVMGRVTMVGLQMRY